jgi:hypothetical protein
MPHDSHTQSAVVLERFRLDPRFYFEHALGAKPWDKQVEIAESVRDSRETAVRSCHGAGKSYIAARIVCWFLSSYAPALVVTTATTQRQVRGILWKEIRLAHERARLPLGGRVLTQQWMIADDRFAIGFTAPEYDPERFSGWHSDNVLAVVDEASGVSHQIQEAVDSLLSGGAARKLEIGNPVDPASAFATSFRRPGVSKLAISAFDTPNFTTFGITESAILDGTWETRITDHLPYPMLVTPQWVADVYAKYGRDNPYCVARVRAEFPQASEHQLIPLELIEAAQARTLEPGEPVEIVCDPARLGPDEATIWHRRGRVMREHWSARSSDLMQVTGECVRALQVAPEARVVKIDEDGLGGGVVDRLREILTRSPQIGVYGMRGGLPARDDERYFNSRAEWYSVLLERLREGSVDLPERDERLAAQLASIRLDKRESRGRVKLESKEVMTRERGLESPDRGDTVAMAFAPTQTSTSGPVRMW